MKSSRYYPKSRVPQNIWSDHWPDARGSISTVTLLFQTRKVTNIIIQLSYSSVSQQPRNSFWFCF